MNEYWDDRFRAEGRIWGDRPSRTAEHALKIFQQNGVKSVLVPGSGYGRNTRLFSVAGFEVTGVEISPVACAEALNFDPLTRSYNASTLDMSFLDGHFDAVYCFNVLHLFWESDRRLLIRQCAGKLKNNGLMYFTVFSDREASFGKGREVENNTFESKPGRPAHYFTEEDLKKHFKDFALIELGLAEDPEDHGEGPHTHLLRYIFVRTNPH
jgi:SAM-dependent methyltransferase